MAGIAAGQQVGRWTVLEECSSSPKGEKQWLCRCQCGTRRFVLERSLRYGGSLSCGCMRREAVSKAVSHDIIGQTFGELKVIGKSEQPHENGGIWWKCQCSCGKLCEVPATLLVKGRKTHCGCKTEHHYHYTDITGKAFGRLTAVRPTKRRDRGGSVMWHCQCSCGREVEVAYNSLMYANQTSCGCQKKEHDQILRKYQTRVDGTSLDMIKSKKLPSDNTTGHKGVYLVRGKYMAKIVLQQKAYYLGTYERMEEAVQARKEAEDTLYRATVDYHARWQERAEKEPQWARENPMRILVDKDGSGLKVSFLPELDGI